MDMHNACTLLISMDHSKYCGTVNFNAERCKALMISMDNANNDNVNTVNFNVVEPSWSNEPKSALQPHLKLVTAASHVHAFWEGDSSMEHRCGRTRRWWGHGPRKNKLHFFRKDGFISIGFGNINAILIFASSGIECCFRKNLLLANYLMELKRKIILHWSYDRSWRRSSEED